MSRSLNKVMLIGNVGNEPEVRSTPGGNKVAKLSLATNRTFSDRNGQQQEKTEWHRLTFWAKLADLVEQYIHKGDRLYVEGRLEYSQTEDDKGNVRYWTDIVVQDMVMLGGDRSGGGSFDQSAAAPARRASRPAAAPAPYEEEDDDLPF
ncbi:MAG TPA: single-stranded DNA-binding protein [Longimicrobiales bacterium]|nr:single-stranded DNA-binding protein [Longimicrobiales bacterium]